MLLINLLKHNDYLIELCKKSISFIFSINFFPECMFIYKNMTFFNTLLIRPLVPNLTQDMDHFCNFFTIMDHYLILPPSPITSYFIICKYTVHNVLNHLR